MLLQWGRYRVDETDNCVTTPLMDALRSGHTDIADMLLWQHKVVCVFTFTFLYLYLYE